MVRLLTDTGIRANELIVAATYALSFSGRAEEAIRLLEGAHERPGTSRGVPERLMALLLGARRRALWLAGQWGQAEELASVKYQAALEEWVLARQRSPPLDLPEVGLGLGVRRADNVPPNLQANDIGRIEPRRATSTYRLTEYRSAATLP